jgi:hypothetical protein
MSKEAEPRTISKDRMCRMSMYLTMQVTLFDEVGPKNWTKDEKKFAAYIDDWLYRTSGWPFGSDALAERNRMLVAYKELDSIDMPAPDDDDL